MEPQDLTPEEALFAAVTAGLLDVHTSLPGRIVRYDAQTQRATVRPCSRRALPGDAGGIAFEDLPDLPNVLVAWPGGGGFALRFPLAAGDSGWLIFSETDSSGWEQSGDVANPQALDRHGMGSPIFYPLARAPLGGLGHVVAPEPFIIGDGATAQLVARADKVDAALSALASAFSSWTPVPMDGGAALKTVLGTLAGSGWPAPTACAKLKAE